MEEMALGEICGLRIDRGKTGGKEVTLLGKAPFAMPVSGLASARAYFSLLTWTRW